MAQQPRISPTERKLDAAFDDICKASCLVVTQLVKKRLSKREMAAALARLERAESQLRDLISGAAGQE